MLLAVKLAMLGHALRVKLPRAHAALWTLAGLCVALGSQLIPSGLVEARVVAVWRVPRVESRVPLDDWGATLLAAGFVSLACGIGLNWRSARGTNRLDSGNGKLQLPAP